MPSVVPGVPHTSEHLILGPEPAALHPVLLVSCVCLCGRLVLFSCFSFCILVLVFGFFCLFGLFVCLVLVWLVGLF